MRNLVQNFKDELDSMGGLRRFRRALRSADVFLVGHPKSGNTWLTYMIALLKSGGKREVTLRNLGEFVPYVHGKDWQIAKFSNLESPRIFRNEWPLYLRYYPKIVYLVRDPRSVLVSYFHHHKTVTGSSIKLPEFVDTYLKHGCIPTFEPKLKRWDTQVHQVLHAAPRERVLIVKYEEMLEDRRTALEMMVHFTGMRYELDVFESALELADFGKMRDLENRFGAESYIGSHVSGARFVRKGQIDSWQTELDQTTCGRIEQAFGPVMREFGYLPS